MIVRRLTVLVAASAAVVAGLTSVSTSADAHSVPHAATVHWNRGQFVDPARGGFATLSCPSATSCIAITLDGRSMRWDGQRWHLGGFLPRPLRRIGFFELSCPTTSFCAGIDEFVASFVYRHGRWTVLHNGPSAHQLGQFGSLSCASQKLCIATDLEGNYRTWNGNRWSAKADAPGTNVSMFLGACAPGGSCIGATDGGGIFRWTGSSWTKTAHVHVWPVWGLTCARGGFCAATGPDGWATHAPGRRWRTRTPLHDPHEQLVPAIACVSAKLCTAASAKYLWTIRPSSVTRTRADLMPASRAMLSCGTGSLCAVVTDRGQTVIHTAQGWGKVRNTYRRQGPLRSVSCPTTTWCGAVDGSGAFTSAPGNTWRKLRYFGHPADLDNLTCPTVSFCMTLDSAGDTVRIKHGARWQQHHAPMFTDALSCAGPTLCLSRGLYEGDDYTEAIKVWDGTHWDFSAQSLGNSVSGISCIPGGSKCMVAEQGSRYVFVTRTHVTRARYAPGLATLDCPSASFCAGFDHQGRFHVWRNGQWSRAHDPAISVVAFSCTGPHLCVAISDHSSDTWRGGAWGPVQTVPGAKSLVGISCVASLCRAIDAGTGRIYRASR